MPRLGRYAGITPVHVINKDNFYGVKYWRWCARFTMKGELVCMGKISCKANHKTKKSAIECAMKMMKCLRVKRIHIFSTVIVSESEYSYSMNEPKIWKEWKELGE